MPVDARGTSRARQTPSKTAKPKTEDAPSPAARAARPGRPAAGADDATRAPRELTRPSSADRPTSPAPSKPTKASKASKQPTTTSTGPDEHGRTKAPAARPSKSKLAGITAAIAGGAGSVARIAADRGAHLSVRREPLTRSQLEGTFPTLRGKLDPPTSGRPPKGVSLREDEDGTRVVSINIHQAVPDGRDLEAGNQEIDALRDVAAWVNAVDADVVAVQEVNDHDGADGGVPHQASVLYHLLDADDMSFTPALGHEGYAASEHREYGTATYTRNGHVIEQSHDVDLPNDRGGIEDRSAGVSVVRAPDGERTTVVNTHLSAGADGEDSRRDQLAYIADVVEDIRSDGSISFNEAISEDAATASGLARDVVVVGDLNATRGGGSDPDGFLDDAGLQHASEDGRSWWDRTFGGTPFSGSIDHLYRTPGLVSRTYEVEEIPADELEDGDGPRPTDHPAVVIDVDRD
jgi:endonuclease/exonuclease/phosphatase family metal-dependent hydrolase